jgi:crotonobetainyl-CoA:carnitine CoA-transferase CaiB-like acyl-CoA transferase
MSSAAAGAPTGALSGVRVLDFTRLGFGSQATLILGCLGAEVIRVESARHPDPIRVMPPYVPRPGETSERFGNATMAARESAVSMDRGAIFFKYNTGGKKSIAVNARDPRGFDILKRLVAVSDVVTESFALGTMERWGLSYDVMREQRRDVIYVSMSGYGHEGPDASYITMGPTAQALTGLTYLVGLPGREPAGWSFSYLDHVGGYLGAVAVLSALVHRRQTGEGQYVDVSQLEPATALAGPLLLDKLVNDRSSRRPDFPPGNRRLSPAGGPQGAYRTTGKDQWLVISCTTEPHWRALVAAIGSPMWAEDARFATLEDRVANADELDKHVETWTLVQDKYDAMHLLQRHGVPAGAVQDSRDRLENDPQLRARGHYTSWPHREQGAETLPLEGVPFRMSATPPSTGGVIHRGPPCLGEDTEAVLVSLLGMDADEVRSLAAEGVLA